MSRGIFAHSPREYDRLTRVLNQKHEDARRIATNTALVSDALVGEVTLDPTDSDHITAVTDTYEAMVVSDDYQVASPVEQNAAVIHLVGKTGMVPPGVIAGVSRQLRGTAETQSTSAHMIVQLDDVNSEALDRLPEHDLARGRLINALMDAGLDTEDAVERASQLTDASNAAQQDARARQIGEARSVDDEDFGKDTGVGDADTDEGFIVEARPDDEFGKDFDEESGVEAEPGDELAMSLVPPILKLGARLLGRSVRKSRRFGKKKDRYKKTNDGLDLVQFDDGKVDFGEIDDDLAIELGVEAAKIRLEKGEHDFANDKGFGDVHIEVRHGDQIRNIVDEDGNQLFADVGDYVGFVAENWTEMREGKNGRLMMVVRDADKVHPKKSQLTMVVELVKADGADFYTVVTAGPFNNKYISQFQLLKN